MESQCGIPIAEVLKKNSTLQKFYLHHNTMKNEDLQIILKSVRK